MSFITTIQIFMIGMPALILIHELGHYFAARRMGVRVLKFSVGVGPEVIKWVSKRSNIRYSLSLIPMGGYVKMLSSKDVENEKSPLYGEKGLTFECASLWSKFWIVLWGPLMNGLLAVALLTYIGTGQQQRLEPMLGETYGMAKLIGFQENDIIKKVGDQEIADWTGFMIQLAGVTGKKEATFDIERNGEALTLKGDMSKFKVSRENSDYPFKLGFHFILEPNNKIYNITKEGAADKAGLTFGDEILSINGINTPSFSFIVKELSKNKNATIKVKVKRGDDILDKDIYISEKAVMGASFLSGLSPEEYRNAFSVNNVDVFDSFVNSLEQTYDLSTFTVKYLWKIISNEASVTSLSGPVTMANAMESGFNAGLSSYLYVISLISISLMIFNLLPIPVLDGGNIVIMFFESVFGPISEKVILVINLAFSFLIIAFMSFITFYDIYKSIF